MAMLVFIWVTTTSLTKLHLVLSFLGGSVVRIQCRRQRRYRFPSLSGKIPGRRKMKPTSVFLPGEFHGRRSLGGYNPWHHKESDTTKHTCILGFELANMATTFRDIRNIPVGKQRQNRETQSWASIPFAGLLKIISLH